MSFLQIYERERYRAVCLLELVTFKVFVYDIRSVFNVAYMGEVPDQCGVQFD